MTDGKMHMVEWQWVESDIDFFEDFKNYDEARNQRRIQCLKYLVLEDIPMQSKVNPSDIPMQYKVKTYPDILVMTNLVAAYQINEILEFEKILKSDRTTIMYDSFIHEYI